MAPKTGKTGFITLFCDMLMNIFNEEFLARESSSRRPDSWAHHTPDHLWKDVFSVLVFQSWNDISYSANSLKRVPNFSFICWQKGELFLMDVLRCTSWFASNNWRLVKEELTKVVCIILWFYCMKISYCPFNYIPDFRWIMSLFVISHPAFIKHLFFVGR